MAIAIYNNKVFEVDAEHMYTFSDFQYNSTYQTEKQDADGSKPSTYNKGPDLDNMSFKIKLDASMGIHPRNEWGDWKRMCQSGAAYPFILGGIPLGDTLYQVVSVSPSNFVFGPGGEVLSLELSIQLDEYVREGSAKETETKAKVSSAPGIAQSERSILEAMITTPEKASEKRENPNMSKWVHRNNRED